uniref:Uncharacterized protein n=1 Tax=Onchocerca volvulus TaxID=6282 RepID=A0A8R1U2F3_ONCVO
MKKGIKLEVAQTQGSNQTEGKLKDQVVNSEEEEEDDTMKGIVSLEQDLNVISIEE